MMGELHTVSVGVGLQTSTYKQAHISVSTKKKISPSTTRCSISGVSDKSPTLKVLPAYKAGIDIDVGEGDGAEFLKVKVQHTPGG